jgi:outer membrane lipoprotein SlyB
MRQANDSVIDRVKVREVAAVFRSREALDAAVGALLTAGFDRADIDLMASVDAVREKLGGVYVPAADLADIPNVPRQAFVPKEGLVGPLAQAVGILAFLGATAAAIGVAASGGAIAVAAVSGGLATGSLAAAIAGALGRKHARALEAQIELGGLILWVRVHSPEDEAKAQEVLIASGGEAVRVHEIEIEKRLEHVPLSSLLAEEPS